MHRIVQLDYLKIILAALVITIHTPVCESLDVYAFFKYGIARVAVPLFLLINGYYLHQIITDYAKVLKYVKRLVLLYLLWWVIYLPFFYHEFKLTMLLNGYMHLWYLSHLALATLFLYLLVKLKINNSLLFIFALTLYFLGYFLQFIKNIGYPLPLHVLARESVVRNFIIFSFPHLFLGYSLHCFKFWEKLSKFKLAIISLGAIMVTLEALYLYAHNDIILQEWYIGNLFIIPFVFMYFKDLPKTKLTDDFLSQLSIAIFLTHVMVIDILNLALGNTLDQTMKFILVLFFTLLLSFAIININKRIKIFL